MMNTIQSTLTSTALLVFAVVAPVASSNAQGVGYCFGDVGSGTPCPCNNDNDGSVPESGCANGVFASGAHLSGSGTASLSADTLVLATTGLEPSNSGLYFQADNDLSPGNVWGDGLQCAGGQLKRLGVCLADASGYSDTSGFSYTISAKAGNVMAGDTKYYQCWYRTTANPPCGPGNNDFNTSNGYAITWTLSGGPYDEMVPIPAREFEMGDHHGMGAFDELPVHAVFLDAFYMDVYEVSNQKYADYLNSAHAQGRVTVNSNSEVIQVGGAAQELCDTTASSSDSSITWNGSAFGVTAGKEDHPMVEVSWFGSCTYANQRSRDDGLTPCYDETTWDCQFTANGYRLPTEAEWEYAARGGEYFRYYLFPWGHSINGSMANYYDSGDPYDNGTTPLGYYDGNQTPPGSDMANGYGLYDMAGNVFERCWDWYDANYYSYSPYDNPTGPTPGNSDYRICRGGGWSYNVNILPSLRVARRGGTRPTARGNSLGLRLVARP